jgi:hypothetical protein
MDTGRLRPAGGAHHPAPGRPVKRKYLPERPQLMKSPPPREDSAATSAAEGSHLKERSNDFLAKTVQACRLLAA